MVNPNNRPTTPEEKELERRQYEIERLQQELKAAQRIIGSQSLQLYEDSQKIKELMYSIDLLRELVIEVRVYGNSGTKAGDLAHVPEDWDRRAIDALKEGQK